VLPLINGEFGVVGDPEIRFSEKGTAWVKIRGVAKDSVRDANGTWGDGDPLFIDILINAGAEHLFESIVKGNAITVSGKLKMRTWEKDGQKNSTYQIQADSVGVATRWGPAKTTEALADSGGVNVAKEALGAVEIEQTEAPF
jgi:single-strand DNA-binding protein